jgi:hypothetical protein
MRRNWHSSDKCVLFGKLCAYILVVANNLWLSVTNLLEGFQECGGWDLFKRVAYLPCEKQLTV